MRVHKHTATGPVHATIDTAIGIVNIHSTPDITQAYVELTALDEVAEKILDDAKIVSAGGDFTVTIPDHNVIMRNQQGSHAFVSVGNVVAGQSIVGMVIGSGNVQHNVFGPPETGKNPLVTQGFRVQVFLPEGSDLRAHTVSGDVFADDHYKSASVTTVSGDITLNGGIDGDAELNSTSGDINVRGADDLHARSVSGDVRVRFARVVNIHTTSGDIRVKNVTQQATLNSMSGDIEVASSEGAKADARTMSGDITGSGQSLRLTSRTMSGRTRHQ